MAPLQSAAARRLLVLAAFYEGASRTAAATIGGVTLRIVRDWVLKFNADGADGLIDLCQWLWEEFHISIAKPTMSREVRAMGYHTLSARPRHHAQAEGAVEDFKKVSQPVWKTLPARRALRPPT